MGTEVLYPQDCLPRRLRSSSAAFLPRRKPHKAPVHQTHTNSNTNPRSNLLASFNNTNPRSPCRKAEAKVRRDLVMGQVTILKRGESLDEKTSKSLSKEKKGSDDGVLSSEGCGDLIVYGTGWLGPDPAMVPKQIRLGELRPMSVPRSGVYAGSVCAVSPSPSALPLPSFSIKKETCAVAAAAVDMSATNDLRRLLRLV